MFHWPCMGSLEWTAIRDGCMHDTCTHKDICSFMIISLISYVYKSSHHGSALRTETYLQVASHQFSGGFSDSSVGKEASAACTIELFTYN